MRAILITLSLFMTLSLHADETFTREGISYYRFGRCASQGSADDDKFTRAQAFYAATSACMKAGYGFCGVTLSDPSPVVAWTNFPARQCGLKTTFTVHGRNPIPNDGSVKVFEITSRTYGRFGSCPQTPGTEADQRITIENAERELQAKSFAEAYGCSERVISPVDSWTDETSRTCGLDVSITATCYRIRAW